MGIADGLDRLAEAVADRSPIDWEAENRRGDTPASLVGRLKVLDLISMTHRELLAEDSTAATMKQEPPTERLTTVPSLGSWGPLDLIERVGEGTFGEVYRAFDPVLEREVALKIIKTDFTREEGIERRFLNEARRLAKIRHENVIAVHGADTHGGRMGIWMDFLSGKNLQEILDENGRMGPKEAALIGVDICRALAAVHAAGLVHRDVKASNVVREQGGRIILLDFGTVSKAREVMEGSERTSMGGTPVYMAPETLNGEPASVRSDVYALGVLLYHLVTDAYPADAMDLEALRAKHRKREVVSLRKLRPDVPVAFVKAVNRATSYTPRERYADMGELEEDLLRCLDRLEKPREETTLWSRIRVRALAGASAILLLLVGYLALRPQTGPLTVETCDPYRYRGGAYELIAPGDRLLPEDRLSIEIRGDRQMFVYVINADSEGSSPLLLFPWPASALENPLPGGASHRLPGKDADGNPIGWQISTGARKEHFLVVASVEPLQGIEAQLQPRGGEPIAAMELDLEAIGDRGSKAVGRTGHMNAENPALRLLDLSTEIMEAEGSGKVWTWHFEVAGASP